jgi:hypothetical protein
MSELEADLKEVLRHLRQARRAMRRFMAVSPDWTAALDVDEQFAGVEEACRAFARHQYGLRLTSCERTTPDKTGEAHGV